MIVTCPKCGRKGSLQRHHLANRRGELHYGVQHRMGGKARYFYHMPREGALAMIASG